METIYTKTIGNRILNIYYDTECTNPRENDNLTTIVCVPNKMNLGDNHDYIIQNTSSFKELQKLIEDTEKPLVIVPLYVYDHSGISISINSLCLWDSCKVGFVYITPKAIDEIGIVKEKDESEKDYIERLTLYLTHEVNEYAHYVSGNMYRYQVDELQECPCCKQIKHVELDSSSGFYGTDWKNNGLADQAGLEFFEEL